MYETHLLRRSYREDGRVKTETLGNLSHLPAETIGLIRRSLKGEAFLPAGQAQLGPDGFQITRTRRGRGGDGRAAAPGGADRRAVPAA